MVAGQAMKGRHPRRGCSPDVLGSAVLICQCHCVHTRSADRLPVAASSITSLQEVQHSLPLRCSELEHTVRGSSRPTYGGMPAAPHQCH